MRRWSDMPMFSYPNSRSRVYMLTHTYASPWQQELRSLFSWGRNLASRVEGQENKRKDRVKWKEPKKSWDKWSKNLRNLLTRGQISNPKVDVLLFWMENQNSLAVRGRGKQMENTKPHPSQPQEKRHIQGWSAQEAIPDRIYSML